MARDWESTFRSWASPPGKTEQERCENAIRAIKNAITRSPQLNQRDIKVFTHGSYRNNTNVRQDSDVDIGILCTDTFFYEYFGDYDGSDFQIYLSSLVLQLIYTFSVSYQPLSEVFFGHY